MDNKGNSWTEVDDHTASKQGWLLGEVLHRNNEVLLITRNQNAVAFQTDDAAVAFVKERATQGDQVAAKALSLDYVLSGRAATTPHH